MSTEAEKSEHTLALDSVDQFVSSWIDATDSGEHRRAAELAIAEIQSLAQRSERWQGMGPELTYGVRILLNGLRDVSNLELILEDESWLVSPRAVDVAWSLAHDIRERILEHGGLGADFRKSISEPATKVFEAVQARYGDGIYNSGEFIAESVICSICGIDVRGCEHIPGNWYGGEMCRARIDKSEVRAFAFVDNPRDPRCRVWPWQVDRQNAKMWRVCLFKLFSLEGDDDGGTIVDLDQLFPRVRSVLHQPSTGIRYEVYAYRKIKRKELIGVVRQVLAERKQIPKPNSRIRMVTIVGHGDD